MMLIDRRSILCFLHVSSIQPFPPVGREQRSPLLPPPRDGHVQQDIASTFPLNTIVDCICSCTPDDFRRSVKQSGGKFLYRGYEEATMTPIFTTNHQSISDKYITFSKFLPAISSWFRNPEPDLLFPETYKDPNALAYFECLEQRLLKTYRSRFASEEKQQPLESILNARPSNGHIASSDPNEASRWGDVVSVWPLGDALSYVWPRNREIFFPYPDKNVVPHKICQQDNLVVDNKLEEALKLKREVLYTSWFEGSTSKTTRPSEAFLVVPIEYDSILGKLLERINYGLNEN